MRDGRTPPKRRRVLWAVALLLLLLTSVLGACTAGAPAPDSAGAPATPALASTAVRQAGLTATPTPSRRADVTPTRTPKRRLAATATATFTPVRSTTVAPTPRRASATPAVALSGLPTISYDRLPAQAWETIALIQSGGPFPYRQDGAVFQNRERRLPAKPSGYYHEYTVVTPGSHDRGARRIVSGKQGELYYTDDHYDSFKQVVMP